MPTVLANNCRDPPAIHAQFCSPTVRARPGPPSTHWLPGAGVQCSVALAVVPVDPTASPELRHPLENVLTDMDVADDPLLDRQAATPYDDQPLIPYTDIEVRRLHEQHGEQLAMYVRQRLRGDPEISDIAQQIWFELIRSWMKNGGLREPRTQLFWLAEFRIKDRYRELGRNVTTVLDDDEALERAVYAVMGAPGFETALISRLDVTAALRELPVRQREAVMLHHGFGLTNPATAAVMACTTSQVQHLLKEAKVKLVDSRHLVGYRKANR